MLIKTVLQVAGTILMTFCFLSLEKFLITTSNFLAYFFIQVYLGDSVLVIEVERDCTVYGDELKFGGGKVKESPARSLIFII